MQLLVGRQCKHFNNLQSMLIARMPLKELICFNGLMCLSTEFVPAVYEPRCEKTGLGVPTRSHTNRAVQPQKMARDLKFRV